MQSIVLITGASGGIGRALSHQLHSQGLTVAVVGRDAERLSEVDADLRIVADTTTYEGAELAINACKESLDAAPSMLAHCVGSTLIQPLHRTSAQAYREVIRVNLDSAVFMLHEAIAAAKGGVEALVRSAAATYAAQGLRINAVAPGLTETPMTANMLKMPAMREGAGRQYPLGGIQSAEQVADVMSFLLSSGAARLTGQIISVDGGFTTVRPLVR
jgi:NAD(P)-dependent dehydrogenase (short-subunit alcohol dehydrogenase family)